jgi:hypothetical protein
MYISKNPGECGNFKFLGSVMVNNARCTHEIKSRLAMAKAAFNNKKILSTSKLDLNLRKKLVKCYIWSMALYGAETWTLRKVDQKYLESFEMWCWRRTERINWTDSVKNKTLHSVRRRVISYIHLKEERLTGFVTFCVGTAF